MTHPIIKNLFADLRISLASRDVTSLFADGRPVFIYGIGSAGKDVFQLLIDRGFGINGFLDRSAKPGAAWKGVPILTPDDPSLSAAQRQQMHLVIGIFNPYTEIPPIIAMLKSLGYDKITSFLELHDHYAAELGNRYWLTDRAYYLGFEPQASEAYALWSDDQSRSIFTDILRSRFTKDYQALPAPSPNDQYFPKGLPAWPTPVRLVDCGAFDGDTLKSFSELQVPLGALAAFEPDLVSFDKLAQYIRAHKSSLPSEISLFPCGVSASNRQFHFFANQGWGSHIATTGESTIQCVALDDVLPAFRPNFIKMDVEGSEYDALWGARQLIAEHRPGLAICLYHHAQHLWQLPLLVRRLTGTGGKFYLRSHQFNSFELVLYWYPD